MQRVQVRRERTLGGECGLDSPISARPTQRAPWAASRIKATTQEVLANIPRNAVGRRVALSYHSVGRDGTLASTAATVFRSQLEWLKQHCRVVPFSLLMQFVPKPGDTRPLVAITFDDGYEDNYWHAFAQLREFGLPATFFITTGLIDGDTATFDELRRLWGSDMTDIRGLTWQHVEEMRAAHMEFGAHSRTHPNLRMLRSREAAVEIVGSKERLEQQLRETVRSFAYPFGDARFHFSSETIALVADSGFESAATVEFRGIRPDTNPLTIPRFPVSNDPVRVLRAKIMGSLDLIGVWRQNLPNWITAPFSTSGRRA